MAARTAGPAANDNEPRGKRRVVNELPQDAPIAEEELRVVETYFAAMIEGWLGTATNDNTPAADKAQDT